MKNYIIFSLDALSVVRHYALPSWLDSVCSIFTFNSCIDLGMETLRYYLSP